VESHRFTVTVCDAIWMKYAASRRSGGLITAFKCADAAMRHSRDLTWALKHDDCYQPHASPPGDTNTTLDEHRDSIIEQRATKRSTRG
jgi:hypothetical protein